MPPTTSAAVSPSEAVAERLNDPAVAASLVTILDHAELLSTLVLGLGGFLERGDQVIGALAEAVGDLKAAGAGQQLSDLPKLADVASATKLLVDSAPTLQGVLQSSLAQPESVAMVSMFAEAANEGLNNARRSGARVDGVRGAMRTLKDPDVQRGLGILVEIARALGRRAGSA